MKFIQDGWHWLEVDAQGHVIRELTNAQHAIVVQQMIDAHAHNWLIHFSLWWTHGSHNMAEWLTNSMFQ